MSIGARYNAHQAHLEGRVAQQVKGRTGAIGHRHLGRLVADRQGLAAHV